MATSDSARSVKIAADERTGWSSERPRRDGAPPRPADVSVRSQVLRPSDRMRYSPGSLLLVVGSETSAAGQFLDRVLEDRGLAFSMPKVRTLLKGRVPDAEIESKARTLLDAAVSKRIEAGESVVVLVEGFDAAERERYVRIAHGHRRPRHMLLIETPKSAVGEDGRAPLAELRRSLDAGELGADGFHTAVRLSGNAISELKRIVFRPLARDD
jgi:hypothetical protein